MKTRNTLLVVFVSFISIARLAQCGASTILDDRDKETEELEELVRKEIFTSLQFLGEDDDDDEEPQSYNVGQRNRPNYSGTSGNGNRNRNSSRYYQNPTNNLDAVGNSYKTPEYSSYYGIKPKPNEYSNYRYNTPNQETRIGGNSKTARSTDVIPSSAASAMNTREPGDYTATVTLPSLGGGRLFYGGSGGGGGGSGSGGGYGASVSGGGYGGNTGYSGGIGGRWGPSGLIRRGIRRLGRFGNRFGAGNGLRYGLGGGAAGLLGGAGSQGLNLGWGGGGGGADGGGYYDFGSDGSANLSGNGRQGYYGSGRYGVQGDYDGSGIGGSWSAGGDGLNDYYNLRYGSPASSGGGNGGASLGGGSAGRGAVRYTVSYPNDSASSTVSTSGGDPVQYELMFLKDQSDSSNNGQIQAVLNQDNDAKLTATSEGGRDTSGGAGYRVNVSGTGGPKTGSERRRTDSTYPGGVEQYRVVVLNKDSAGNGSGRSAASMSSTGSAPGGSGSTSWTVSSNGSGESSSGSTRNGFQITTPITSTQVTIPPTTLVGSVLSSVQGAATGDQTRSLGGAGESSGGKIIQLIKTS